MSTYERFILGQPRCEHQQGKAPAVMTKKFHVMSLLDNREKEQIPQQEEQKQQQVRQKGKKVIETISSHSWNPYNSNVVAIASTTSSTILICSVVFSSTSKQEISENINLKVLHSLNGYHAANMPILSLDWCCNYEDTRHHDGCNNNTTEEGYEYDGKIVSCGEDCKAFVWSYDKCKRSWVASQIFLQEHSLPLTPMCCQWNQSGDKILIGMNGGSKTACLNVCSFNDDLKEWTSLTIGRNIIKSTVLCVQWKPKVSDSSSEEDVVASGGCDYKCRVFRIASKNSMDTSSDEKENSAAGAGEQIAEFATVDKTWVTSVAWSPINGNLAFSSHLSYVYVVVNPLLGLTSKVSPATIVFKLDGLSYTNSTLFANDMTLYCAGYDGRLRKVVASSCKDHEDCNCDDLHYHRSWKSSTVTITEVLPWKQSIFLASSSKTAGCSGSSSNSSSCTNTITNRDDIITCLKIFKRKQSQLPVAVEKNVRKEQQHRDDDDEKIFISAAGSFGIFKIFQT